MKTINGISDRAYMRFLFFILGFGFLCGILFTLSFIIKSGFFSDFSVWIRIFPFPFIIFYSLFLWTFFVNMSEASLLAMWLLHIFSYIAGMILGFVAVMILLLGSKPFNLLTN